MSYANYRLAGVACYSERDGIRQTYDTAVAASDLSLTDTRFIQQGVAVGTRAVTGKWLNTDAESFSHITMLTQDGVWPLEMPNGDRYAVRSSDIRHGDEKDRPISATLSPDPYARLADHFQYADTLTANTVALTPITLVSAYTQVGSARHSLVSGNGLQLTGSSEWTTALTEASINRSASQCLECWALFYTTNISHGAFGLRTLGTFDEQPLGSSGVGIEWDIGTLRGLRYDDTNQGTASAATGWYLANVSVRRGIGRLRVWFNASIPPKRQSAPLLRLDSITAPSEGTLGMAVSIFSGNVILRRWWCSVYGV